MSEIIDVPAEEVQSPKVEITMQELGYLYQVLVQSAIPGRDAKFVANLQEKLKVVLNIKE